MYTQARFYLKTTSIYFEDIEMRVPLGKKTRQKKGQKTAKRSVSARHKSNVLRDDFARRCSELEKLFEQYNPHDVSIAINISDLWLPNISSQVKHILAFCIFASIAPQRFTFDKRIESYSVFQEFANKMHGSLPDFTMMEDYVPETDWGEVKISSQGQYLRLFYGNSVERISDYVEAFKLQNCSTPSALNDLHTALRLQDNLISTIDKAFIGDATDTASGHLEIPDQAFWNHCRAALIESTLEVATNPDLVIDLGTLPRVTNRSVFSDAIMTGTVLPALSVRIENKQYPLSLRNALSTVIDYWDARYDTHNFLPQITESIAAFLGQRFHPETILRGPLELVTPKHTLPYQFAAFMHHEKKCQLIIVLNDNELALLPDIERDARNTFLEEDWCLRLEGDHHVVDLRDPTGNLLRPDEITIIAVIPRIGTALKRIRLPETDAQVLWLPDFVTIFDSLEDFTELDQFWSYLKNTQNTLGPSLIGITDLFATFRDSHGVLIAGAVSPDQIFLDPHWGSNWRYRELSNFWRNAPALFPNGVASGWTVEPVTDGIQRLISKSAYSLSWCTTIRDCVLHFVYNSEDQAVDELSGRLLELIVQCLADALFQRRTVLSKLPIFARRQIVTICCADASTADTEANSKNLVGTLFSRWRIATTSNSSTTVAVFVDLAQVQTKLIDPTDSRFEAECAKEWTNGIEALLGEKVTDDLAVQLMESESRQPRFNITRTRRTIDAPEFVRPVVPKLNQYKIARRDLAITFRSLNTSPGRYELAEAKRAIDPARDAFRKQIHDRISKLDQKSLLIFCIQQHDALTVEYIRAISGVRQSLSHQVSYDRSEAIAEAYDKFSSSARNYRYLLEFCLSERSMQAGLITNQTVIELIASIDWLFVLYNASDVLHNGLDAAGVELDSNFVPEVFYSSSETETTFGLEMASSMLGIDLEPGDEVNSPEETDSIWAKLDRAFLETNGFSFTHLKQTLLLLSRWQTARGEENLQLYYQASVSDITEELTKALDGLTLEEANRLVSFATLEPKNIRRLLGKPEDESDVPVWEHNKRGSRYTIRPLIPLDMHTLAWGAAAAERSLGIWTGSINNGYLPADFPWPRVQTVVRTIKANIERQLEVRAGQIFSRTAPFSEQGIDFKYRFPREKLDDVGDYDVLAYWPQSNTWLAAECKYNQPPHCLKDARRLRDRIFGISPDRGQFSKIERRREFLSSNLECLRILLGWPAPSIKSVASICEVYISREIHWSMRNPPYDIPTHFLRIDALDSWLRTQRFSEPTNIES